MCKKCDYITTSIVDKSKKHDLPKSGISKFHERMGIFLTIKPKKKKDEAVINYWFTGVTFFLNKDTVSSSNLWTL